MGLKHGPNDNQRKVQLLLESFYAGDLLGGGGQTGWLTGCLLRTVAHILSILSCRAGRRLNVAIPVRGSTRDRSEVA